MDQTRGRGPHSSTSPPSDGPLGTSYSVKLPALIGGLLAVVIAATAWANYQARAQAAQAAAGTRLREIAADFAQTLDETRSAMLESVASAARNRATMTYLRTPTRAHGRSATAVLRQIEQTPQTVAVELVDAQGRVVLRVGPARGLRDAAIRAELARQARASDSGAVSGFRMIGDSLEFAAAATVVRDDTVLGMVVRWASTPTSPGQQAQLNSLIGRGRRIFIGNASDSNWSNLSHAVSPPPIDVAHARGVVEYQRRAVGMVLARVARVSGTPWVVVVEIPRDSVLVPIRADAVRLLLVDALVALLGLIAAFAISRRLTGRLGSLTQAAEAMAVPDDELPAAPPPTGDELSRLSRAFHTMAGRVNDALAARTASEEQYRRLFESVPLPVYVFDVETLRFLEVNGAAVRHYGYSREAFLTMTLRDIRSAEDVPRMEADVHTLNDRPQARGIWRHLKHDGTPIDVEVVSHMINFNGRHAALTVVTDVTERNVAAEALRRSEERYRALFREAPFGIALSSVEGRIVDANPALASMLGYPSERDIVGRHVAELYANPDDRGEIFAELQRAGHCRREALQWMRQDGRPITARFTARVVSDARHPNAYVEAIVENVTERVRLEEQFRQAQKMEAIGRLAGGIAHDFNNLLTVILATTELLLDRSPPAGPEHAELEDVYRSAQRGADLTRQLLAFSRRQMLSVRPLSANTLVRGTESLLRRLIGEDVRLNVIPAAGHDTVLADAGQLEQVLMNLAVNARDAMPDGGALTIETHAVELTEDQTEHSVTMPPGAYLVIAVSDTGVGMDAAVRAHIFEPFFTTKDKDKGTGLGLATVYGIVKQMGGYIWVYSEVGVGTTFKIYLPRVAEAARGPAAGPSGGRAHTGTETLLLAEDEPGIRNLLVRVLTASGYTVLAAAGGEQATELARGHALPIHLLVTDVVMAGMHGPDLARHVAELHPEAAVLFLSGYTDEAVVQHGVDTGRAAFLQKPFTHHEFLAKVRDVLHAAAGGEHRRPE